MFLVHDRVHPRTQRIANCLLLNASFVENTGLLNGKLGISLFFFRMSDLTDHKYYADYAWELLEETCDSLNQNTSTDFENGLAGIGWGIEFLAQNGFIDPNTNSILQDFDSKLLQLINQKDNGLQVIDTGLYFLQRLKNPTLTSKNRLLIHDGLKELIGLLDHKIQDIKLLAKEPEQWSLIWPFAIVIWFLGHINALKIELNKSSDLINTVLKHLSEPGNLPKKHTYKLLLSYTLACLSPHFKKDNIINLLRVERGNIESELEPDNSFILRGTSGISWLYKKYFELTGDLLIKKELSHWSSKVLAVDEVENGLAGYKVASNHHPALFTLIEGITGIGLVSTID